MTFTICRILCPGIEKTLLLRKVKEGEIAVSEEKGREITTFFSIICEFSIFMLPLAIIMQYLYDSV